jgi:hypothetical protein
MTMTSRDVFLAWPGDSQFSFSAMFTPPKKAALRRMKLEELIFKMQQIEEQAALTLHEYSHGHTVERQRLVMAIAKQVRAHLVDQVAAGERAAVAKEAELKLRVVDGDAESVRVAVLPQRSKSAEK